MPVQYYFDNLDPVGFQRLVNALLNNRFGEEIRLLPLRGKDGGRDAETRPPTQPMEFVVDKRTFFPPRLRLMPGRHLFQAKHHRMSDHPGSTVRSAVVADFEREILDNVLNRGAGDRVNYFFLTTNVPASKDAISKVDEKRRELLAGRNDIHADVLWQEHVTSWLDQSPGVWAAFPELFAGMQVPMLGRIATVDPQGLPRSFRMAVDSQFKRDDVVRFKQINLETRLSKLFIDLDVNPSEMRRYSMHELRESPDFLDVQPDIYYSYGRYGQGVSSIELLASEGSGIPKRILLEGGPGQGKSTATQMLAQIYRSRLLGKEWDYGSYRASVAKARFPFRVELRIFAEWLGATERSVEQYLSDVYSRDAGGSIVSVDDIHSAVQAQPVLLVFDGLDEVGSDDLRDKVITKILECASRFEDTLGADVRVIITSRPPAIAASSEKLSTFTRIQILPLSDRKVDVFVDRWTEVQCTDTFEREQVLTSFKKRKSEEHVSALVKNPMQLSVLLHFIRLKGEAFPDRRAELYREYFKTVIDRDVEKSPRLRQNRDDIEALHEVIGFEIHSRAESDTAATSLSHEQLIEIVRSWLKAEDRKVEVAGELFKLGEERLGLIVALKGEGVGTRYGFEVQPVREYFAAAYINDKCEGNAHDLFELMVRRPFWREVALFLAGLRRANEKADLLSRARALDDDAESGWRCDGRAIVLQLLQEGVLVFPGHVHRDAVSMLVESLDPLNVSARNEPNELVTALPRLIRSCENPQPRAELQTLLEKGTQTNDTRAVWRPWTVAHRIMAPNELERFLVRYEQTDLKIFPALSLLWPAEAGQSFGTLLDPQVLLNGAPKRQVSERWFEAVLADAALSALHSTKNYHESLLRQFAFQPLSRFPHLDPARALIPVRPYAVWRLCQNIQLLALQSASNEATSADIDSNVDYSGLSESTIDYMKRILDSSTEAIRNLNKGRPLGRSLASFFRVIDSLLGHDGMAAWVACRCATTLIQFQEGPHVHVQNGQRFYVARQKPSKLAQVEQWRELRRHLTPFFRAAIPHDLDGAGRTMAAKIVQSDLCRSLPSHVRVAGNLQSVPELLASGQSVSDTNLSWLEDVPIARYWIPGLLDCDSSFSVLARVAARTVSWFGPIPQLRLTEMKRIFSVASKSSDEAFLSGALFALAGSSFWNVASSALIAKMLQADAEFLDIGGVLFAGYDHPSQSPPYGKLDVAAQVVRGKIKVSQSTATAAARFLAANTAVKLPPLRSMPALLQRRGQADPL